MRFERRTLKAIYFKKCIATLFFFVESNSPWLQRCIPHGPNLALKSLYLVGTVLN